MQLDALKVVFLLSILVFLSGFYSCQSPSGTQRAPIYIVTLPNGKQIKAEEALDKRKGLMGRASICKDCGMLFIYEEEGLHSYWMKNVLFPLDLIWLSSEGRVVYIVESASPCFSDCRLYTNTVPAKYVLEVMGGVVKEEKLSLGDSLVILKK